MSGRAARWPGPRFERGVLGRLAVCVALKAGVICVPGLADAGRALGSCVKGACFVPSDVELVDLATMIFCLLPTMAFCLLFSDVVFRGLSREGTMILPRIGGRASWARSKALAISGAAIVFAAVGDVVAFVVLGLLDPTLFSAETAGVFLSAAALEAALLSLLGLAVNALSLRVDPIIACAMVAGVHAGALIALRMVPAGQSRAVAAWVPSAWGVLAWEEAGGQPFWAALALLVALSLAVMLVLVRGVRRCDLV